MAEPDATENMLGDLDEAGQVGEDALAQPRMSDRRDSARRLPRKLLCVECRAGVQGLGANIAEHALDISESGMSFTCTTALERASKVLVFLFARGHSGSIRAVGDVVRCEPIQAGLFDVALHFERRLKYAEYQLLT